jgi:hypothetical protein
MGNRVITSTPPSSVPGRPDLLPGMSPNFIPAGSPRSTPTDLRAIISTENTTGQYPLGTQNFNPPINVKTISIAPRTLVKLVNPSGEQYPLQNNDTREVTYNFLEGRPVSSVVISDAAATANNSEGFNTCSSGWMWVAIILAIVLIAFLIYYYKKGQLPVINTKPTGLGVPVK